MRFTDEYRTSERMMQLIEYPHERTSRLSYTAERPLRIMKACGDRTHAILKFGLDQLLPENIEFTRDSGHSVCVLPMGRTNTCTEIANHPEVIFCTFGDTMHMPGRQGSLLQVRARSADVRIVYSSVDVLRLTQKNPTHKVMFFDLGLETTMPITTITPQQAKTRNMQSFYFLCQYTTLVPTLRSLLKQPDSGTDVFLAPGRVSMVIGTDAYNLIANGSHHPLVAVGFEPLDPLRGVVVLVQQKIAAYGRVGNQYHQMISDAGNLLAQQTVADVFCISNDDEWCGLGVIESSDIYLTPDCQRSGAEAHFRPTSQRVCGGPRIRHSKVLTGECKLCQCPLFDNTCNPQATFGMLMISSEETCTV